MRCQNLESLGYIYSTSLIVWVYLHSNFRGGSGRRNVLKQCVMALQGHPRSLILAPIESAYATSYWSSIITLKQCVMVLQGHPRSLILAPIESAYATSYWPSIITLVLSCSVSGILQVFCSEQRLRPYSTRILGCSRWTRLPMLWLR